MPRVNIDDEAYVDERFDELGRSLGAPAEYAPHLALGVMVRVWNACTVEAKQIGEVPPALGVKGKKKILPEIVLGREKLNRIGKRADFADLVVASGLGRAHDGGVAIAGSDRCWWIVGKVEASKKGGEAVRVDLERRRREAVEQEEARRGPRGPHEASHQGASNEPPGGPLPLALVLPASSAPEKPLSRACAKGSSSPISQDGATPFVRFNQAWKSAFFERWTVQPEDLGPFDKTKDGIDQLLERVGEERLIGAMQLFVAERKDIAKATLFWFTRDAQGYLAKLASPARASPSMPRNYVPDGTENYGNGKVRLD